jgi:hypothetical protein
MTRPRLGTQAGHAGHRCTDRLTAGSLLGRFTIDDIGPAWARLSVEWRWAWSSLPARAVAAGVVQLPRPVPTLSVQARLPAILVVSGAAPALPWSGSGEAGVDLPGVGTLASPMSDHPVPMASLANVMTAYVVLHDHPLAVRADGSGKHGCVGSRREFSDGSVAASGADRRRAAVRVARKRAASTPRPVVRSPASP